MCASPFDAAIHDAAGLALGRPALEIYDQVKPVPSSDDLFPGSGAIAEVAATLRPTPVRLFNAWFVASPADDLRTLADEWVRRRGYRCAKLKVTGTDPRQDATFTVRVFEQMRACGASSPLITVDSNGVTPGPDAVLEYLANLRDLNTDAYDAVLYIEQPTGRDLSEHSFHWGAVASRKPVLIDEGLTGVDALLMAKEQGWSGFVLKTCKGHSFMLVTAAWARCAGMLVSLQDLTNPGLAAVHAALLAAYVPTLNGVELNSPQFTPDANKEWLPRFEALLEPRDGVHRLPDDMPCGLGSQWQD